MVLQLIKSRMAIRAVSLMLALLLFFVFLTETVNVSGASANLLPNPSAETAAAGSTTAPASWVPGSWGTNSSTFTWQTNGQDGTRSMYISMAGRTSGDAKWASAPVTVKPGTQYQISDWSIANAKTSLELMYTSTTGAVSYGWLKDVPATSSWTQNTATFTTPSNAAKVTIMHIIAVNGNLQSDNYSLNDLSVPASTPPTVSFSAPASGATVSGKTVTVSANAADAVSVSGVQFKLDGANLGAEDVTAPYSVVWDTTTAVNGSHTLTATARNGANLSTTATETVTVNNAAVPSTPSVTIISPASGSTVAGVTSLSANASDTNGVAGVSFKIDNVLVGTEDTTAPYSVSWDSKSVSNGSHTLTATARNTAGTTATATQSITVQNPTAPTVSFSAPASGATVSGKTVTVSANAADAVSVAGVQFKADGINIGAEDTVAPYSVVWDTTALSNGSHTLTATARNGANLSTNATETVTVSNTVVTPPASTNLIPNPSFETSSGTVPQSWIASSWGTNTNTFSYLNSGHTGTHSAKVQITSYSNGAANWYYNDVPVTSGKTYKYENWYQSNVDTEVDAEVVMSDGSTQYFWLGTVFGNANWTKFSGTFTPPAGAKTLAIYQTLAKVGYIVSDDYSLSEYTPTPLSRGLVSVTLDDGWANQYQNALPALNQYGIKATFYIISGSLTDQPDYMSATQVKNLFGGGHEIGSHSVTHSDMTTLGAAQLQQEFQNSQVTLQNTIGVPVTDFAYPYGAYNANTLNVGAQYYQSQRSVVGGFNTKDGFDIRTLKIFEVDSNISQAQVKGWIDGAIAQHSWLILVYHEVATTPADPSDALYTTKPADFAAEMAYLKGSGVATPTVHQAIAEILPQL